MKVDSTKAKLMAMAMATAATAALAWTGCDSHDEGNHGASGGGHTSPYPACNEIVASCHEVDTGAGEINDCHSTAHDAKSDGDCTPIKDRCLQICAEAKADGGGGDVDAGDRDGG